MGQRVLYEGHNLSLREGTGIKTYAANLVRAARRIGLEPSVALSTDRRLDGRDALLAGVQFVDAAPVRAKSADYASAAARSLFGAPFGIRTRLLPSAGLTSDENRVADDWTRSVVERHAAYRLTQRAQAHFLRYGRCAHLVTEAAPGIFHATHPIGLRVKGAANIYTIHDLAPLRLPWATLDHKRHFLQLIRHIARTADHIVTVSDFVRRELQALAPVSDDRITTTHQTSDLGLGGQDARAAEALVENVFQLAPQSYFLFFGALEPKKNVPRLIEAYLASGVKAPLVLAGGLGWGYEPVLQLIGQEYLTSHRISGDRILAERKIRRVDYLSKTTLAALVRCARSVLFPSLYEGFGLPVLEAMQLGAPVMTSDVSALPEVAGDAALLVDPLDVAAMASTIRRLDSDAGLRDALRASGMQKAQAFSQDRYDTVLHSLYGRMA